MIIIRERIKLRCIIKIITLHVAPTLLVEDVSDTCQISDTCQCWTTTKYHICDYIQFHFLKLLSVSSCRFVFGVGASYFSKSQCFIRDYISINSFFQIIIDVDFGARVQCQCFIVSKISLFTSQYQYKTYNRVPYVCNYN